MATCEETAGFLICAPCKRKAAGKCRRCSKPICEVHSRKAPAREGNTCITCHRKGGAKYEEDTDDPYLFSGYYYHDYYDHYDYGDNSDWGSSRGAFNDSDDGDWESDFDGS